MRLRIIPPARAKVKGYEGKMPAIEVIVTTSAATGAALAQNVERNSAADRPLYLSEYAKSVGPISPKITLDRTEQLTYSSPTTPPGRGLHTRNAVRDANNSVANEIVWTLRCDEASYSVRLIPHVGTRITPIR